jgi:hypothetical protein
MGIKPGQRIVAVPKRPHKLIDPNYPINLHYYSDSLSSSGLLGKLENN